MVIGKVVGALFETYGEGLFKTGGYPGYEEPYPVDYSVWECLINRKVADGASYGPTYEMFKNSWQEKCNEVRDDNLIIDRTFDYSSSYGLYSAGGRDGNGEYYSIPLSDGYWVRQDKVAHMYIYNANNGWKDTMIRPVVCLKTNITGSVGDSVTINY